jgi:hypothetical protein
LHRRGYQIDTPPEAHKESLWSELRNEFLLFVEAGIAANRVIGRFGKDPSGNYGMVTWHVAIA